MTTSAPTRYIDPALLARIGNLELVARAVVEGFVAGLHRSPYKGFSVEFMEYRPYMPGDDPMRIDWKLYARSDRMYVKEFEDETNTRLRLVVDVSGSMDFASGDVRKVDYAFLLAASLAYFVQRQRDAVGLVLFDEALRVRIPPRSTRSHLQQILMHLEEAEAGAPTQMGKPLHDVAEALKHRGFVILISDALDDPQKTLDALQHIRYYGHQVLFFHVMDRQELEFTYDGPVEFEDAETGEIMLLDAGAAATQYKANVTQFIDDLERGCTQLGIDYTRLITDEPLDRALFDFLAFRAGKG
ncbi:MAG: DUF58 domain-containing protein [Bacteroidota bacterium]